MIATQAIPLTTNNNQRLNCLEINPRDNKAVSANLSQLPPFHFFSNRAFAWHFFFQITCDKGVKYVTAK